MNATDGEIKMSEATWTYPATDWAKYLCPECCLVAYGNHICED